MKEPQAVFTDFLTRKNLKMTPQRRLILDVFLAEDGHLASEDLYNKVKAQDKSIGQATVY
ncbi:transcriptional repressor, partial [Desulfocurvus sp.]|uniref:Fur family transcriptional regulator n=1 Tax=Desulfocurvus sp. TaxID=2871698 RepID=UPI0025B83963